MMLDNLGIQFPLTPRYCDARIRFRMAHREVFGKGKVQRWTMRHIFPRLRPREYERRVEFFEKTRAYCQQIFLIETMRLVEEKVSEK